MTVSPASAHGQILARAADALASLEQHRLVVCSPAMQRKAVALLSLSGREDVALYWVRLQQWRQWKIRPGLAVLYGRGDLATWSRTWSTHPDLRRMRSDPLNADRQRLQLFAAEFLTHLEVHRLHCRGLRVPSCHVVATYLASLGRHPLSVSSREHVDRLQRRAVTAKKWGRAFRQRWGHLWGSGGSMHGVTDADTAMRSGIFFRWLGYVLAALRRQGSPIVVNMDETMLSAVKPRKLGVVPSADRMRRIPMGSVAKERALPRTSLTAAVCSDAALQRHLPQMRLPRVCGDKVAGLRARQGYAAAGQPQMTVHGTGGWNSAETVCLWLSELKKRLHRVAPGRPVLLVMDACAVHLCHTVLRKCISLGIALVIIPARCTWLLQPLDTHVFAKLKNEIRQRVFQALARAASGKVSPGDRIRLHGAVIRSVLVEQDWSRVMLRSGLTGQTVNLRSAVRTALGDGAVRGRRPTEAEIVEVLQVPVTRATRVRDALLATVVAAAGTAAAAAAAAAAADLPPPDAAPADPPAVRFRPVPTLSLSARARLPAMPRRDLAPAFLLERDRRSPVLTRSRTAAAAAADGSAAASSAPATPPAPRRRRQ